MSSDQTLERLLAATDIDQARSVLEALPFPVMLIAEDYRVTWLNQSARETYKTSSGLCHQISHGHSKPCDQHGEACPKAMALASLRPTAVYHAHGNDEHSELYKVIAIPTSTNEILELHIPLDDQITTDSLTGLYTRPFFEQTCLRQQALLRRMESPYSLLLIDLDHFKSVNDQYGHLVGDEVLHSCGQLIASTIRSADTAGRWGGEEFVVFQPGTSLEGALRHAERLRAAIEKLEVRHQGKNVAPSASIGVAQARAGESLRALFERADQALYEAKNAGRNRVVGGE
jgi:diguanylate cyclase (GGDEF)-like protein